MLNFFKKKKNNIFVEQISAETRNKIIAMFFKHMFELYASDALVLRVPIGNFNLIQNKFYFEVAKEFLKKMEVNVKIEKIGIDATKPEDRYFRLTAHE